MLVLWHSSDVLGLSYTNCSVITGGRLGIPQMRTEQSLEHPIASSTDDDECFSMMGHVIDLNITR